MSGIEINEGMSVGVSGAGGFIAASDAAICAKETTVGDVTAIVPSTWVDLLTTAVVPKVNLENTAIEYVGNGRFQNKTGASQTFSGFVIGVPYSSNLSTPDVDITIGLWDGFSLIPDAGQSVAWLEIKGVNTAKATGDAQVFEYEIVVPNDGIFGLTTNQSNAATGNMVLRGFSHTTRIV